MKMTREHLEATLRKPGYSIDGQPKANPDLGRLPDPKREPDLGRRSEDRQLEKGTQGMGCRVEIISLRTKLVDGHDNLRTGAKALVDAITRSLGFYSDDNPRLTWEYAQAISDKPGTIVRISWT